MIIQNANLWEITDSFVQISEWEDERVRYEYVIENGVTFIYMGVDPEDGYRSSLAFSSSQDGTNFHSWEKRKLTSYSSLDMEEDEEEGDEYGEGGGHGYVFSYKGESIGRAWHSHGDGYYPSGSVHFDRNAITKTNLREMNFMFPLQQPALEGTQRKVVNLSGKTRKRAAFIVTGEPRLGKTTFCENYIDIPWFDTDELFQPGEIESHIDSNRVFVVGKYRNVVAKTDRGNMSFATVIRELLADRGFDVYELRFVAREGEDIAPHERYNVHIQGEGALALLPFLKENNHIHLSKPTGLDRWITILSEKS